jgi:hypothetical protein
LKRTFHDNSHLIAVSGRDPAQIAPDAFAQNRTSDLFVNDDRRKWLVRLLVTRFRCVRIHLSDDRLRVGNRLL